jgi:hypothetical protein
LLLPFNKPQTFPSERIGPHNFEILSILIISLLGNAYAEKRGEGTIFRFYYSAVNSDYVLHLHKLIANYAYCKQDLPLIAIKSNKSTFYFESNIFIPALDTNLDQVIKTILSTKQIIRFKTFSFSSLN